MLCCAVMYRTGVHPDTNALLLTVPFFPSGRGTDILLGGNPDYMARLKLREMLMPAVVSQV